nr:glycosyltransferase family 9 protein [Pseudobdellovibrionaceae bacterium]
MKILIIQLARLGDIYTSWPVIRAIKRENPKAEIHVLVRKKFEKALVGLESLDHIHVMETSEILSPLASHHPDLDAAL